MSLQLNNIRIVLVETSHPGNIGATARAMKVMGFKRLYLVNPKRFPDSQANIMASGADDILEHAVIKQTLPEALSDCQLIFGTSTRKQRYLRWPLLNARQCGEFIANNDHSIQNENHIALVFGRERSGLSNDELDYCHYLVNIPTQQSNYSLNLAAAVQILTYECRMAFKEPLKSLLDQKEIGLNMTLAKQETEGLATLQETEGFFQHLKTLLIKREFLDPNHPRLLMRRLRRLYARTHLTRGEVNILRGILSACEGKKQASNRTE